MADEVEGAEADERRRRAKAERSLGRGVRWARASGMSLAVLGGLSAMLSVFDPLSATFIVSVAVVVNGILERRFAASLEQRDSGAAGRLAANQAAVGAEVVAYSFWQASAITPEVIRAYLADPNLSALLEMYPADQIQALVDVLPGLIQAFYALVAAVAVVGCGLMALFYLARRKHVTHLAAGSTVGGG